MTIEAEGAPEGVTEDTAAASIEAEADTETSGDNAPAAAVEGEAEPAKPKKSAQDRIDELTRARREAERDRDFYKEQALRQAPAAREPQAAAPVSDEPDPADYEFGENDLGYVRAIARYEARQEFEQHTKAQLARSTVETKLGSFQSRSEAAFPDGEPEGLKAFRTLPEVPQAIADVILESDIGPKLAEHLGDNPREFRRISGLSPALQARELTLLETRLSAPPKPTPKTATDAPEPPPQARGTGGRFTVAADTDDFAAFEKQHLVGG